MTFNRVLWLLLFLFLYSCKNSSHVVNDSVFQKRKYQRGWYVEGSHRVKQNVQQDDESIAEVIDQTQLNGPDTLSEKLPESSAEVLEEVTVTPIIPLVKELVTFRSNVFTQADKSHDADDFGLKKKKSKKRKEKFTKNTEFARWTTLLATWGYDWPFYKNIIGIIISGIAIILAIYSLTKLKRTQKRNKVFCYVFIVVNVLAIVISIVVI